MRITRNQSRAVCASIIIIAFFIPAYGEVSALGFLNLAIHSASNDAELTLFDLTIVLIPLLLIPLTAILILFRSLQKRTLNSLLLGIPFVSLIFFMLLVWLDINQGMESPGVLRFFKNMRLGFYLAGLASLLLLFSQSRREALNAGSRRW
jgi:hypothetical protein